MGQAVGTDALISTGSPALTVRSFPHNGAVYSVRPHPHFKRELDHLRSIGDPRAHEIDEIGRALADQGPMVPGARHSKVPFGLVGLVLDGFDKVLEDGSCFIQWVVVPEDLSGAVPGIVMYRIIYFD